jgi:dolichol kinase
MSLAGTIAALAALAVFQGVFNGLLISLIAMLLMSPERVDTLRRWIGKLEP